MINVELSALLLIQAAIVVGLPFLLWKGLRLDRAVPLAVVQISSGILLGPMILGAALPDVYAFLLLGDVYRTVEVARETLPDGTVQDAVRGVGPVGKQVGINVLSYFAVTLFGFLAGAEIDKAIVTRGARSVFAIGVGGMLLNWLIGIGAALAVLTAFPLLGASARSETLYVVAVGLGLAVAALPMLAAILKDMALTDSKLGSISLACAGIGDAILWIGVAAILPFAAGGDVLVSVGLAAGGGLFVYLLLAGVARPILRRMMDRRMPDRVIVASVVFLILTCAAITELTRLHAVVGAFMVGVFLPDDVRHKVARVLDMPVSIVLLPFFFLAAGLKLSFGAGSPEGVTATLWLIAAALVVCVGGKLVSTWATGKLAGESTPFLITLSMLLQTKGMMELVIMKTFADKGIVGPETFSALVIVALVSTALTAPLVRLCLRAYGTRLEDDEEEARRDTGETPPAPAAPSPAAVPASARAA